MYSGENHGNERENAFCEAGLHFMVSSVGNVVRAPSVSISAQTATPPRQSRWSSFLWGNTCSELDN